MEYPTDLRLGQSTHLYIVYSVVNFLTSFIEWFSIFIFDGVTVKTGMAIGMCRPQRVWFLSRFGLKTGIDFDHYGLKSGMVFKGTTRAYKRICLFNSK